MKRRERKQTENWGFIVCICTVMILVITGFLVGYSDSNDIDLHTTQTKQVSVFYPKETIYIENNITTTQYIETPVYPKYEQNCTQLEKPNGKKYIYCE